MSRKLGAPHNYVWERTGLVATIEARQSMHFEIKYQHRGHKVVFSFFRQKSDSDNRANFGERMKERIRASVESLKTEGWDAKSNGNKGLHAEIRVSELKLREGFSAKVWENLANQLLASFD